jgi:hypothetical protein
MDRKHCNTFVHCLNHILRLSLETMGLVPAQTDRELSRCLSELSQGNSIPVLLHDGTEREIPRPVDYDEQKEKYSGKKKRHTVKNAVIITASCPVLFAGQSVCGKMHDKKMADTMYSFPYPCTLYQDTGYQGYRPDGVTIVQPFKKSKGKGRNFPMKIKKKEQRGFPCPGKGRTWHWGYQIHENRQRGMSAEGKLFCGTYFCYMCCFA